MPEGTETLNTETITAWAGFLRRSQALLAAVEGDVKAAGLPPLAWYDALLELKRAGPKGLRPKALQEEMLLAQYNLSRLTERLVGAGLIERLPCKEDGRGQRLKITPAGRALLKRIWPVYRAAIAKHFGKKLSPAELTRLTAILGKLGMRRAETQIGF